MTDIRNITVVGTGVIGIGWIARFLANGYQVTAFDPALKAEEKIHESLSEIWPTLVNNNLAVENFLENFTFETELKKAVANADFVQESVPEREDVKCSVIAKIDELTKLNTIISSSTSGYMPTLLQKNCKYPERIIVSHPFNPVYLIPLVEVVSGEQTDPKVVEHVRRFFESIDMKPLIVRNEIEGHISDRLMEAIWRESLHIVNDGIATTEEVDASIVYGPGLRWALMGPFLTLHLAGGDQGMRHMLHQFEPALKLPWTKLKAPELTDELFEKVVTGCEAQTEGLDMAQLENRRDEFLVRLTDLVEEYWPAANLNGHL